MWLLSTGCTSALPKDGYLGMLPKRGHGLTLCQDGLCHTPLTHPRGMASHKPWELGEYIPGSPTSYRPQQCGAKAQCSVWLSWSLSTGLSQNGLDSGRACTADQSCWFPQAPTRLHFDLLLSQTQNEGRGHRDVQIRSNQEFPSAFTQSLQNIPPSMPPSLPGKNHPSSGCLCPGLGRSISQ